MALNDAGSAAGAGAEGGGGASAGAEGGGGGVADLLGGAAPASGGADGGGASAGAEGGGFGDGGQAIEGGADPDWYQNLSPDVGEGESASNRDWIKAKGFKDLDGLTRAYRAAEKTIHDSGRVKIPGEGASAEEITAFHKAIGVPDSADGYALPEIKGEDGKPIALDQGIIGRLLPTAHALGIPDKAMKGLVEEFVKQQLDMVAQGDAEQQAAAAQWIKEQGANAHARQAAANTALTALGMTRDETLAIRSAIGSARALEMFAKLGEGMAEDVMVTGGRGRFGVTGAEAQGELNAMKTRAGSDPVFARAVQTAGTPENARWHRLLNAAAAHAEREAQAG